MVFSKIDEASASSVTNALDFFTVPPTNVSVSSAAYHEYLPLNPLTSKPFHFKIHASTNYIDLNKCYLQTEMRILKRDPADANRWIPLVNADTPGTIQMIGATFIKNMKVSINGRETFDSNSLYAYLDAELSYSNEIKNSYLQVAGYYTDGVDQNSLQPNNGPRRRGARFKDDAGNGIAAQFISKIDADIFNQELYLVNNIEIDLEITPNDDLFNILSPNAADVNTYKFDYIDCRLFVKSVTLMDGLSLDIARKLEITPARYALRKTMIKSHFIDEGKTEDYVNLFTEQIPRRVIIGLVENNAYRGSKTLSPFMFQPFNMSEISIEANGRFYPAVPYRLDFATKKCARPFHDMNEALGMANSCESNAITFSQFTNGWCIFIFNMTNSLEDEPHFDLIKNGTTTVHLRFSQPVQAGGIVLIAMGETDALLMLDKYRTITSDVTV